MENTEAAAGDDEVSLIRVTDREAPGTVRYIALRTCEVGEFFAALRADKALVPETRPWSVLETPASTGVLMTLAQAVIIDGGPRSVAPIGMTASRPEPAWTRWEAPLPQPPVPAEDRTGASE